MKRYLILVFLSPILFFSGIGTGLIIYQKQLDKTMEDRKNARADKRQTRI